MSCYTAQAGLEQQLFLRLGFQAYPSTSRFFMTNFILILHGIFFYDNSSTQTQSIALASFFKFVFPSQQTLVPFLKRACGYATTSRHRWSLLETRAAGPRIPQSSSLCLQTWPRSRSTSASAPPRLPASSSTSAPSPLTS